MTNVLSFDFKLIKRYSEFPLYTPVYLEVISKRSEAESKVVKSYWLPVAFCIFGHLSFG